MHQSPMRTRRIFSFILAMMLVCVLWLSAICVPRPLSYLPTAAAETVPEEEVRFVPPKLPADAPPYDPEKPEDLQSEQLYAKSAILIEASTGSVIFEKNADDVMFPASTTKIMTVLLGIMM
ncbi:MAG: hypothetical protein RR379_12055, partial [Clostridia bacterium]